MKPEVDASTPPLVAARARSVAFDSVTKRYGDVTAIRALTLEAAAGEFLVLLGPSGCGKSTALRLVAGLETPTEGTIRIGDVTVNDVDPKDRDVAMVFQSYALYPHMTVRRNIEFPLKARRVPAADRAQQVEAAARSLRLDELLDRKPAQLSGGQRQRVALARAIVRRPTVFLMDEPLSNLDAQLRVEMRAELAELHERLGITVLYVTHDQVEAMTMGERIAVLRDGVLQQLDRPQSVHDRPANAFVAGFIGSPPMNLLRGRLVEAAGRVAVEVPGGQIPLADRLGRAAVAAGFHELIVGVRPEDLVVDDGGTIDATVGVVESLGYEQHLGCRLAGGQLVIVRVSGTTTSQRTGDGIRLALRGVPHLFDPDTERRIDV